MGEAADKGELVDFLEASCMNGLRNIRVMLLVTRISRLVGIIRGLEKYFLLYDKWLAFHG